MPESCPCRCGYRCGRRCGLGIQECIDAGHYVIDCGHDWSGPWASLEGGGGTATCAHCGETALYHDLKCGP